MSSASGASAPIFSYAQAAKGLASATSTQSTSRNESPAASDKSVKDRSTGDATSAKSAPKSPRVRSWADDKANGENAILNSSTIAEEFKSMSISSDAAEKERATQSQRVMSDHSESSAAVHVDSDQTSPKDEAALQRVNGRKASSDDSAVPASYDQTSHNASEKKSNQGEDDWEKVSVPSIPAEAQYKAAPLPSVNVWQMRKEAQAAKTKEHPKPIVSSNPDLPKKPRSASEDLKRKSISKEVSSNEREGKSIDTTPAGHRKDMSSARSSRPASQQGEKADGSAAPPVIDSNSWPTPETSNVDDRRRSASYEKFDSKPGSKKWNVMPFVPTAKFETQLPPAAARRGGRGPPRGRDVGGRGGGHTGGTGEKVDATNTMGPPPLPRHSGEQDRGRRPDGQQSTRGTSVPTSRTRPISSDTPAGIFHQSTAADAKDQPAPEIAGNGSTVPYQSTEGQIYKTELSSRSSSRNTSHAQGQRINGDRGVAVEQIVPGSTVSKEPVLRYSVTHDRNKTLATGTSRGNGEFPRERGVGKNRDWSREKPESAREKVESWRDRESSGDQGSRRGGRTERGRGSFRSRGDHTYNPPYTSSHAYTSPLPQNGFEPSSRSASYTESRSRQASQPFVPTQATNAARNTSRSQSIPVGMVLPGLYNGVPAMPEQGLPAIQTDMSMYGYPSQMHMQPSIMSAMPYNDPLNSYALLSMVMTQIEYYFSIDNLCKDLFLRKNMDGQGYVLLSVIANFKRIKTLTSDNMTIENLRYVCQQVKSVEFLPGLVGDDRLRRREGWRDFVLPVEERFETARSEGPVHNPESYHRPGQQEQMGQSGPAFAYGQLRSPPLNMASSTDPFHTNSPMSYNPGATEENHVGGGQVLQPSDDLSNEFSTRSRMAAYSPALPTTLRSPPPNATSPLNNIVNGHHRQGSRADIEENVFPDDQIPNVNIRMRPHELSGAAPSFPGIARVTSGGSSGGRSESNNMPVDGSQVRLSSLRGGAGSPSQLEQFRSLSFGNSNTLVMNEDNIMYFTKDGHETQLPPPQPGQFDQTYPSLHDAAFQERQMGVKGALEPLYNFWTDFLVDKFNLSMYQEFKNTATNDMLEGNDSGMMYLARFFGKVLSGPVPISERLALDVATLSREEKSDKRPVFQMMRAAFRNGATNMKTIKRLGDVLTAEEKGELDKSG